jgi:NADH-quinone oxidoreductase subunit A
MRMLSYGVQTGPMNLENYFPVLLFILVGIGVGVLFRFWGVFSVRISLILKKHQHTSAARALKMRMKFDVRYYLIAILFILFDLETAFSSRGALLCAIWDGLVS